MLSGDRARLLLAQQPPRPCARCGGDSCALCMFCTRHMGPKHCCLPDMLPSQPLLSIVMGGCSCLNDWSTRGTSSSAPASVVLCVVQKKLRRQHLLWQLFHLDRDLAGCNAEVWPSTCSPDCMSLEQLASRSSLLANACQSQVMCITPAHAHTTKAQLVADARTPWPSEKLQRAMQQPDGSLW